MREIRKRFPGVEALKGVDLTVEAGQIHALLGENGAGKSTLIRILSGAERSDEGSIEILGRPVAIRSPADAIRLGVNAIYQELQLVPGLSAAENVLLGRAPGRGGLVDFAAVRARAAEVLADLGADFPVDAPVRDLSVAQRQLVEIARALARAGRILVLDEPCSSLAGAEVERLFAVLRRLKAAGHGIIFVSHRMEEVFEICDRATILRDGEKVGEVDLARIRSDQVIEMMVGRTLATTYPRSEAAPGREILRAEGVTGEGGMPRDASLAVRAGEVVGIAGLVGSGRSELARAIAGAARIRTGRIILDGERVTFRSPRDAIRRGIAFATEDRKADGLFANLTVGGNIALSQLFRFARLGLVDDRAARARASEAADAMDVRPRGIDRPARTLSGGNQQKALLARALLVPPKVLVLDEPTRGIDIGAKIEIYSIIERLSEKEGIAVIVVSSEMVELIGIAHRIIVMHAGGIAGELAGGEATELAILRLAMGRAA
ncbi:MAG: sugar ABC transporter ATP-binding protein [Planctomycetes bacterium]|nr:sugar ABC transporter ATP-binding protein [Planctomycetota bacterium]